MKHNFLKIIFIIIVSSLIVSCDLLPSNSLKNDGFDALSTSNEEKNDATVNEKDNKVEDTIKDDAKDDVIIQVDNEYEYSISENRITLLKYTGKYRTLIEVPSEINGVKVTKIATGCYKKSSVDSSPHAIETDEDNEETDYSTFLISDNISIIEDGSFEENSTFITPCPTMPFGWSDKAIYGSAINGDGNIYYSTKKEETITSGGIVYIKVDNLNGLYVARCSTQRKEVEIPSYVKGEPVVDIGRESFSCNKHIQKVTLPETIGYVYHNAFYNCVNLKEIVFNSPNLSKILGNSFNGCISLDIVKLPENATYIQSGAFSNCGEISELYIPFAMTNIASQAFTNTTVKNIYYSGTEEQWALIRIAADVAEIFESAEISFALYQNKQTLESLEQIKDVELNTFVTFEGVVTGFYNTRGVWVTDPTTNYSILCYNDHGLPFYDLDHIGITVKVSGTKILYTGQIEVTQCEIEILDISQTEITPIELDLTDPELNLSDYVNYYVVIKGVYANKISPSLYIDGSDTPLYTRYTFPGSTEPKIGDTIEVIGWGCIFNQIIEITYDSRLLTVE